MNEQLKLINFTIELDHGSLDKARLYIRHKQNPNNYIVLYGNYAYNHVSIKASQDDIAYLKQLFIDFFDVLDKTPPETYDEMIERRVKEGVDRKIKKLTWFQRLFRLFPD